MTYFIQIDKIKMKSIVFASWRLQKKGTFATIFENSCYLD